MNQKEKDPEEAKTETEKVVDLESCSEQANEVQAGRDGTTSFVFTVSLSNAS